VSFSQILTRIRQYSLVLLLSIVLGTVVFGADVAQASSTTTQVCAQRSFSTKTNKNSICNRYIHTILIADGILLSKSSTSSSYTTITKNSVTSFQRKHVQTTGTTSGKVGLSTWKALCAVASERQLDEYTKAGCVSLQVPTPPATGVGSSTTPPTITPVPAPANSTITFASWNTNYMNSPTNVKNGAKAIAATADIIGFQELNFNSRREAIKSGLINCATCQYSGYFPDTNGKGWATKATVSLIWNKNKFTALETNTLAVLGPNAFGANTSNKWVNYVKLRDNASGKVFYVLNTHFVAHVETNGKPTGKSGDLKNYRHHMNDLVNLIKKLKAENVPIFVTGDFCVDYRHDTKVSYFPQASLTPLGMHSNWERVNLQGVPANAGTMTGSNTRLIDYVWSSDSDYLTSDSASVSTNAYHSDHLPVYYTTTIKVVADTPVEPPADPPVDPPIIVTN